MWRWLRGDIRSPRLILFKGVLFLVMGVLAVALILLEYFSLKLVFLLTIAIWAFCRFYYFAFYVIQHYLDDGYRFSGLLSVARYLLKETKPPAPPND